jgi:hypothetical protein
MSHVTGDCWEPTTQAVEDQGVARAILRMGPVMFKGSPILEPLLLQHRLFAGGPIGSGEQGMSWVHIDDVIGVMRWLLADRTRQGAFNLCAPNPVTNRQASKIIGRVLGRPSYLPTPAFLFRLLFGEMADTILQGPLAYPERLQADGYAFQFPELEGALREILNKA